MLVCFSVQWQLFLGAMNVGRKAGSMVQVSLSGILVFLLCSVGQSLYPVATFHPLQITELNEMSLGKFSRWQIDIFPIFSQKTDFDMACILSPKETICMQCQSMFSGKNIDMACILSPKETICMQCQSMFSGKNQKNI